MHTDVSVARVKLPARGSSIVRVTKDQIFFTFCFFTFESISIF